MDYSLSLRAVSQWSDKELFWPEGSAEVMRSPARSKFIHSTDVLCVRIKLQKQTQAC